MRSQGLTKNSRGETATIRWAVKSFEPVAAPTLVELPLDLMAAYRASAPQGAGFPDAQSLRVAAVGAGGRAQCAPVQWIADGREPLPLNRPDDNVSYLCRMAANSVAAQSLQLKGRVIFLLQPQWNGAEIFLEFEARREVWLAQVPHPPHDFRLEESDGRVVAPRDLPAVEFEPQSAGALGVRCGERMLTNYVFDPSHGAPHFAPLVGPSGVPLTRIGHPHDATGSHRHHRSLWIGHRDIGGVNFWEAGAGKLRHDGFAEMNQGAVMGEFAQKLSWISPAEQTVLHETRRVRFVPLPDGETYLDFDLSFRAPQTVEFGVTRFGFLAFRVAQRMAPYDGGGVIFNSSGQINDRACLRRARWCNFSGPVAPDRWEGIALIDHPENPGFPSPFQCRNDGWLGSAFSGHQSFTLEAGAVLRVRHRLWIHRGRGDAAQIEAVAQAYGARALQIL